MNVTNPGLQDRVEKFRELKETHQTGLITKENDFVFPIEGDFGMQVAKDGRVWICINGIAFLRFKPAGLSLRGDR